MERTRQFDSVCYSGRFHRTGSKRRYFCYDLNELVMSRVVLKGFDFPLAYIRKHKFNQPIFGCNNITGRHWFPKKAFHLVSGEVWSILDNGGPSGSLPPIRFRWAFKSGGVGTFLPLYYTFMKRSQVPFRTQEQQSSSKPMCAPSKLIATAYVS